MSKIVRTHLSLRRVDGTVRCEGYTTVSQGILLQQEGRTVRPSFLFTPTV